MAFQLRRLLPALLPLALAFAAPHPAAAQVDTVAVASADSLYEVRLSDGSVLYGRVTQESGDELTLETQGGATVRLRRDQIVSIKPLRGRVVNGEIWGEDPHATRLFLPPPRAPSARARGTWACTSCSFPSSPTA